MNNVYKLHCCIIKTCKQNDPRSLRSLLLSCAAAAPESLSYVRYVFSRIPSPDTFAYNTIIRVHSHYFPSHSLSYFSSMRCNGVPCDHFTFPFVLKACARLQTDLHLHSLIVKYGLDSDIFVQNSLMSVYGCCGSVEIAVKVFDEMSERDSVSWSTIIVSFVNNGYASEALALFKAMQLEDKVVPDEVTMLSVISAVSHLGALELGRWVRMFIDKLGLEISVALGTALIDMFSRCGSIDESVVVFEEMAVRNVLTWTTLINGFAVHGRSREALAVFHSMRNSGVQPDYITFSSVLVACSHGGLVKEGRDIFETISKDYQMVPHLEHYGCMVDLLGRAGLLNEAYEFVERMPMKPNSIIWRTLLGACANHNNLDIAEKVKAKISELNSSHDGDFVLLSNVYGAAGRWVEKTSVRSRMRSKRIGKEPGCSLINIDQATHEFVSGDDSHPQSEDITKFLSSIIGDLRNSGYTPRTENVLHDIDEEEREHSLSYHSEKLAVAFALLSLKDKKTIRIMKNLRICHDCHSFMKHISDMYERKIIIRDRNRFHHFDKGSCSCHDYW
ncbi:pentatricopeptide repeat-containing protein At5g48910-like [Cucurbita maxima]|uniref:Pentatricopeptide repeat-containing protein At5g48910-like n=1 Tax=Cucurbita maxima TaxID=3661 RepID=A0A6J1HRF3_CUCMA|nr:pentatricopeptide repeat-containing protein At5g48910-like [Cucurbita maxima]